MFYPYKLHTVLEHYLGGQYIFMMFSSSLVGWGRSPRLSYWWKTVKTRQFLEHVKPLCKALWYLQSINQSTNFSIIYFHTLMPIGIQRLVKTHTCSYQISIIRMQLYIIRNCIKIRQRAEYTEWIRKQQIRSSVDVNCFTGERISFFHLNFWVSALRFGPTLYNDCHPTVRFQFVANKVSICSIFKNLLYN